MSEPLRLTYVLSHGDSIGKYARSGLFNVQLALARELQRCGMQITVVSFGGREEYDFAGRLPGMKLLCNYLGLPANIYARRLHQLHAAHLLRSDLVETADTAAIVVAQRIAWAWQIPLVFRVGYLLSAFRRSTFPSETVSIARFEAMERRGLAGATQVIATTRQIRDVLVNTLPEAAPKLKIVPNSVDTELFRPLPGEKSIDLVVVGRISVVKNLSALLEAVERLGVTIALIGGPLSSQVDPRFDESTRLKDRFGDLDGRIHWLGRINHE